MSLLFRSEHLLLIFALVFSVEAQASPWTLPQGRLVVANSYDFQLADSEFINSGGERAFPLEGRYVGATFSLSARLGITDRFELEATLPLRLVSYASDSVILLDPGQGADSPPSFYRDNVINLSRSNFGVGDITLAGRYGILRKPIALAAEVRLKAPSGYDGPQGTFGPTPTSIDEFTNNVQTFAQPELVQDDVTLGDGQLDVAAQVLFGSAFSSGTFMKAAAGYNLRLGGAGDQVIGELKVGQRIGRTVLIYVASNIAYTIQRGRPVGISVAAINPRVPANQYGGLNNILPIQRRLESDFLNVTGGLIYRVAKLLELNLSYGRTLWGRFVAATNTVSLGIIFRANIYED